MIKIKQILVPTDFSKLSIRAIDMAMILSREFHAYLNIVHARVLYTDDPSRIKDEIEDLKRYEKKVDDEISAKIKTLPEKAKTPQKINHDVIQDYSVVPSILEYIVDKKTDLVVMGTHGHTGLKHFLLGSVAEMLIRYALCPVLTVHSQTKIVREPKRILVPFDFSDLSKKAFHYAVNFARKFKSQIDLLYVIDTDVHPALYSWGLKSVSQLIPDIKERVSDSLDEIIKNERASNLKINRHFIDGKPYREIVKFSKKHCNDLIIIGTHGRTGVDKFLLGSVSEKVIRLAQCSVLSIKLHEHDFIA